MDGALIWDGSWAWSLPLIAVTVVFHVVGLGFIDKRVVQALTHARTRHNFSLAFSLVMGVTTLLATLLHAIEAGIWAFTYRILGALPDGKSALLYSLGAMTTYGHEDLYLAPHWRLMGALEALNGMLLFGLSTAFLYGMIQRVQPSAIRAKPWPGNAHRTDRR
jgi:hypothetical protein